MAGFFMELLSEEIPARMQERAGIVLADICRTTLKKLNFSADRFTYGARRIAISGTIETQTSALRMEERGPRETAPAAALAGFLAKHKAREEDIVNENGYFWLRRDEQPVAAKDFIAAELPIALAKFPWPKSMRWGQGGTFTWVRPLRRLVCLLDSDVIGFSLGPVTSDNKTEGHHFTASGALTVSSARDWEDTLRKHFVIADQGERRAAIVRQLDAKAAALGLSIAQDSGLLDEVNGLVEWPVALVGRIDDRFMDLPPEVRELSMKVNQRYFAMRDVTGKPAPYFAFVANIEAQDGGAAIIAGNERVLRARLSDAQHFWNLDLKTPLDRLLPKLDRIIFHAKIGTQRQRSEAIARRARQIAESLDGNIVDAEMAGRLCKADLVTGMVGEFPELQGIMGGYYATKNSTGWNGAVVGAAISTHYQPRGPDDAIPTQTVAISVALADKLNTLIEFFRIDEKPTGSSDPYALRRAALGVIRIIIENDIHLNLRSFINADETLFDFIIDRLRVKLRNEGKRYDVLDAVLAAATDDDLTRVMKRVDALEAMLGRDDGRNLLAAYKRAANILKIETAKDGPHQGQPSVELMEIDERRLNDTIKVSFDEANQMIDQERFDEAIRALSYLREPLDSFFENITVNDPVPELRLNRLKLLARFRDTVNQIADFSKIEG